MKTDENPKTLSVPLFGFEILAGVSLTLGLLAGLFSNAGAEKPPTQLAAKNSINEFVAAFESKGEKMADFTTIKVNDFSYQRTTEKLYGYVRDGEGGVEVQLTLPEKYKSIIGTNALVFWEGIRMQGTVAGRIAIQDSEDETIIVHFGKANELPQVGSEVDVFIKSDEPLSVPTVYVMSGNDGRSFVYRVDQSIHYGGKYPVEKVYVDVGGRIEPDLVQVLSGISEEDILISPLVEMSNQYGFDSLDGKLIDLPAAAFNEVMNPQRSNTLV